MDFMESAKALSELGLLLDLIGVAILWWKDVPPDVQRGSTEDYGYITDPIQNDAAVLRPYRRWSRTAFALLGIGFTLQLLGTHLS